MEQSVNLEADRRRVTVGERSTVLQQKSWQVLSLLLDRAPEIVERAEIIDVVWRGNYLTGDKGLNQAVWSIRSALADDPRDARFIRTVPRVGYQWICTESSAGEARASGFGRGRLRWVAGFAVLLVIGAAAIHVASRTSDVGIAASTASPDRVATRAYLVDRDIHVEFANGCLGILKNANYTEIGAPLLSEDGARIAVTFHKNARCRLATIDVSTGERQDFGACPEEVI